MKVISTLFCASFLDKNAQDATPLMAFPTQAFTWQVKCKIEWDSITYYHEAIVQRVEVTSGIHERCSLLYRPTVKTVTLLYRPISKDGNETESTRRVFDEERGIKLFYRDSNI